MRERRRFPRVALDAEVRVKLSTTDDGFKSRIRDLSETGVFILTEETRPIGTGLELTLVLTEGALVARVRGIIVHEVRVHEATKKLPSGIGVMFLDVDDDTKGVLRDLIARGEPL